MDAARAAPRPETSERGESKAVGPASDAPESQEPKGDGREAGAPSPAKCENECDVCYSTDSCASRAVDLADLPNAEP